MGKKQFIPNSLPLDQFLAENPPDFPCHRDDIVRVLNFMYEIPQYLGEKRPPNGWVPVSTTVLRQWGLRHGGKILSWLVDMGVIETDGKFIEHEKCRWYRFIPPYDSIATITEITKWTLIRKMVKKKSKKEMKDPVPHLSKWFNENLWIDKEGAHEMMALKLQADMAVQKKAKLNPKPQKKQYGKGKKERSPIQSYNSAKIAIQKFADHDYHFTRDATAGRIHNLMSNSSKYVRKFLTYGGKNLVSTDVKNSQPTFGAVLGSPKFFQPYLNQIESPIFAIYDIQKELRGEIEKVYKGWGEENHTFTWAQSSQSIVNEEVTHYRSCVEGGTFYEYFFEQAPSVLGYELTMSRDDLKVEVLKAMYSSNRFYSPVKRIFAESFPHYNYIFRAFKNEQKELLPRMLQSIEAAIIIDRITRRIALEYPNLPIYTVHDSVVTISGMEHIVHHIMEEEIRLATEIAPKLSVEFWTPTPNDYARLKAQLS